MGIDGMGITLVGTRDTYPQVIHNNLISENVDRLSDMRIILNSENTFSRVIILYMVH